MNFHQLFQSLPNIKVAIVGDVMLDTYWWGHVERISPEAVVALNKKELRLGGAGNVALNTVALGAATYLFSVVDNDEDGDTLTKLLQQNGVNTDYLIKTGKRITTNKTRIISRNQQMMRLDAEITTDLDKESEDLLIQRFRSFAESEKPSVVIFEDYNKGVLSAAVIERMLAICHQHNIVTSVDPKRKNFLSYKGVTIFKPNLKEVKEGLNLLFDEVNMNTLQTIHEQLRQHIGHSISLITLSEKGMFYRSETASKIFPTHVRNIAYVSGAGDTAIAVASVVYAATGSIEQVTSIANIAAGIVCEEVGTVAINKEKLLENCEELLT